MSDNFMKCESKWENGVEDLFANGHDAKNLTWHVDGRKSDGLLRHLTDSSQWKIIDRLYPDFGKEARNLRLGLDFE